MSKHNPGPWSFSPSIPEEGSSCYWVLDRHIPIATVDGYQSPRTEANARLIAAAPELLEALESLTLVIGLTAIKHESQRASLQEAFDIARAAIAKAKGESK